VDPGSLVGMGLGFCVQRWCGVYGSCGGAGLRVVPWGVLTTVVRGCACHTLPAPAAIPDSSRYVKTGGWDSIHVTEIKKEAKGWEVRLSSTIIVQLGVDGADTGDVSLSGTLSHQVPAPAARYLPASFLSGSRTTCRYARAHVRSGVCHHPAHVLRLWPWGTLSGLQTKQKVPESDKRSPDWLAILGSMIEDMESTMRNNVDQLYFAKVPHPQAHPYPHRVLHPYPHRVLHPYSPRGGPLSSPQPSLRPASAPLQPPEPEGGASVCGVDLRCKLGAVPARRPVYHILSCRRVRL
jgi:hypothetical protein